MKLTPLDIESHQFAAAWRGYAADEVRAFLALVAAELAGLLRERQHLAEQVAAQRDRLAHVDGYEERLRDAMLAATQLREATRDDARREADLIIKEARLRAEEITAEARASLRDLRAEAADLRGQRARLLAELRGVLTSHDRLLAHQEAEEERRAPREDLGVDDPFAPRAPRAPRAPEALARAQDLTLSLGESSLDEPPAPRAPRAGERGAAGNPSGEWLARPAGAGGLGGGAGAAGAGAAAQGARAAGGAELLQQLLSATPSRVDPRSLSLPPRPRAPSEER